MAFIISAGDATLTSSPIAFAAVSGSATDFWLRETIVPPAESFDLS
jgi:hypothetical protein